LSIPQIARPPVVIQPPPARVYVSFSAEINPNTTESLIALMSQQVNAGVREVYLMLSTPGGSVMHGMNLYNVLRGMPFDLTTHNVGNVDSIGNVIFLAGKYRYACPNTTFMFHGVGFDLNGQIRLEEKLLQERLNSVLSDNKRIGAVIKERTSIPEQDIDTLFLEAKTKDTAFAISSGIIHEVKDIQIPPGGPVYSLVFQR
jgi:ATP-dependent protease ClpP protease subunit